METREEVNWDGKRRRALATALYRPEVARLIIVGEAPPPERFFYWGDSLFFRYLRRAFVPLVPDVEAYGPDWFLAFFHALGGWRADVCDEPQRGTKGGADDVSGCLDAFAARWEKIVRHKEAVLVVSPKRLVPFLPDNVRTEITTSIPPPGQWNAHRQAFLTGIADVLTRWYGQAELRKIARSVAPDDAALDFEIARACAENAPETELRRLVRGHEREAALVTAWETGEG